MGPNGRSKTVRVIESSNSIPGREEAVAKKKEHAQQHRDALPITKTGHHCGTCFHAYNNRCENQGHMVVCAIHPKARHKPGGACIKCTGKVKREDEKESAHKAAERKKAEEEAKMVKYWANLPRGNKFSRPRKPAQGGNREYRERGEKEKKGGKGKNEENEENKNDTR